LSLSDDLTSHKECPCVKHIGRIELGVALAALALALIAGLYLVITTFAQKQECYGIQNTKIVCHPLTPDNLGPTAARLTVSLGIVLVLYAGGALSAWGQQRAQQPDARLTAYLALVTCALTILGFTLPALAGVGFFFVPSTLLMLVAALIGLPALLRARKPTS
jgi:hypothetical protein